MANQLITSEKLMEMSGLEENISVENVAEMIKRYNLTEEFFEQLEEEDIADAVQMLLMTPYMNCYAYLFNADALDFPEWKFTSSKVLRVATYLNYGILNECIMIDFENEKIYYDEGRFFFNDISEAAKKIDLTTDMLESITDILKEVPQTEWKYVYEGGDGIDVSDWHLSFETSEGIIRYTIIGNALDAPEELTKVAHELLQIFREE